MTDKMFASFALVKLLFATVNASAAMRSDMAPKEALPVWSRRTSLARKKRGMSARALSAASDLSPNHVGTIERGETAGIEDVTLRKLARGLSVPAAWLMGEGDDGDPWADGGDAPADDRYPNRRTAAALLAGLVDAETVNALGTMRLDSDRDLTVAEWVAEAKALQAIRSGVSTLKLAEIDDAPRLPRKK